jgi:methionine aminopeptidase
MVEFEGSDEQVGKDVAMHIAAMKPVALSSDQVPSELIEKERSVAKLKAEESGKPADIAAKMVEGSVQKYLKEVSLFDQTFVKNDKQTGQQMLKTANTSVKSFVMFIVGEGSIAAKRLCQLTYDAMWHGIVKVKPGARLGDIGHAIQVFAEGQGFSIVREFCGHGIGQVFHEDPQVLHYGKPGTLEELKPGMTFTIEPMVNAGRRDIKEMSDGWTIITRDHSLSAQWEHTVLVTQTGYEVLTLSEGSPPPPSFVSTTAC